VTFTRNRNKISATGTLGTCELYKEQEHSQRNWNSTMGQEKEEEFPLLVTGFSNNDYQLVDPVCPPIV
jgi:hypothetical protein